MVYHKIGQRDRRDGDAILDRVLREDLWSGGHRQTLRGRAFQAEGTESAKVWRPVMKKGGARGVEHSEWGRIGRVLERARP